MGNYPKYGCSQHFNRGACSNCVMVRRDWVEQRLLDDLQNQVLKREAIEYVLDEVGDHVKSAFASLSNQMTQMRERKQKLEGELRRLASTAAETSSSAFLVEAIYEREQQLRQITDQLLAGGADSVDAHLSGIRKFVTQRLGDLRSLLAGDLWLPGKSFSSIFQSGHWLGAHGLRLFTATGMARGPNLVSKMGKEQYAEEFRVK